MCGIVGIVGKLNACKSALNVLKNLEYRGYDSAGLAYLQKNHLNTIKALGKLNKLKSKFEVLEEEGIGRDDFETENFNITPERQYRKGGAPLIVGYKVTNSLVMSSIDVLLEPLFCNLIPIGITLARYVFFSLAIHNNLIHTYKLK